VERVGGARVAGGGDEGGGRSWRGGGDAPRRKKKKKKKKKPRSVYADGTASSGSLTHGDKMTEMGDGRAGNPFFFPRLTGGKS
jgi:hypothetical protein